MRRLRRLAPRDRPRDRARRRRRRPRGRPLRLAASVDARARRGARRLRAPARGRASPSIAIAGNHSTPRFRSGGSVFEVLERFGIHAAWERRETLPHRRRRVPRRPARAGRRAAARRHRVAAAGRGRGRERPDPPRRPQCRSGSPTTGRSTRSSSTTRCSRRRRSTTSRMGHLHRYQAPQVNAIYPGSLERLDFADLDGEKAVLGDRPRRRRRRADGFVTRHPLHDPADARRPGRLRTAATPQQVLAGLEQSELGDHDARPARSSASASTALQRDVYHALDFGRLDALLEPCLHHVLAGRRGWACRPTPTLDEPPELAFGTVRACADARRARRREGRSRSPRPSSATRGRGARARRRRHEARQPGAAPVALVRASCDLEFPDGLIGIRGANGAGKTTIAEAIGWALFGKLRPGAKIGDLRARALRMAHARTATLTFRLGDDAVPRRAGRRAARAKLWIGDADEPETSQTRATNARHRPGARPDLGDVPADRLRASEGRRGARPVGDRAKHRKRHVERLLGPRALPRRRREGPSPREGARAAAAAACVSRRPTSRRCAHELAEAEASRGRRATPRSPAAEARRGGGARRRRRGSRPRSSASASARERHERAHGRGRPGSSGARRPRGGPRAQARAARSAPASAGGARRARGHGQRPRRARSCAAPALGGPGALRRASSTSAVRGAEAGRSTPTLPPRVAPSWPRSCAELERS